ncbi:MAG: imidazole glycerol phosphate synthase subunit HisH [Clostridiales Family XIII bacterium]|jgi:glutamine amidotransferase|nr:imidazole glycerol phosphate synthase subunit HisH [Clostridiales Family XIII bacterium]
MIAIIDYGAGNLFSVHNALSFLGFENRVTSDPSVLHAANKLILPGVGAFPDAMGRLRAMGLDRTICQEAQAGKPLLGICLGMQLLFEKGYEFTETEGLSLIEGYVDKIIAPDLKIPHMGWDEVEVVNPSPLTKGIVDGDMVYFVHSYKAVTAVSNIRLATQYGQLVPALVEKGNVFGAQFHPEKSSAVGLKILNAFGDL